MTKLLLLVYPANQPMVSMAAGSRYPFLTRKERDVETGLDYFEARYYSSVQGRFTSPDEYWESLWAYEVEPELYSIDNVPFFARGVSWGDVVSVERRGDELHFKEVVRPSRHSVIRVIVYDSSKVADMHDKLKKMKCDTEQSHLPSLLTVDCPPTSDLRQIRAFLKEGEADGRWTYEEASIREPTAA